MLRHSYVVTPMTQLDGAEYFIHGSRFPSAEGLVLSPTLFISVEAFILLQTVYLQC